MFRKLLLALECALLFIGLPAAMWAVELTRMAGILLVLWILAFFCLLWLARGGTSDRLWNFRAVAWKNVRPILLTFLPCAAVISAFTWAYHPEKLFSFPRERPQWWAVIMVLYPLLSVLPQEIIYRAFFFRRYRELFPGRTMVAVNAALFAFCHLLFNNALAVAFTLVGGVLFARTYLRAQSLALVTFEHALYGCFIFTIGLGQYFYHAR